ncbi:uncharacterized protein LOC112451680 [Temnothorax curvispinosus]|uniref:Uncharacterized protein LOC112451680 n=1 Tax=Temnothorax curvispinosus TaxID=300111 RepID=A0A6J1PCK2_9HYME|nr:uncharacterized protein LOC112451680 [Temnothorax curvispinosus]
MKYSSRRGQTREKTEEDPRMSSGSESFTDTAIHAKLEPPRSLHGVEDADVIWDTITRRFPNAAPLLCEMETVIERAEDLLQQLKTPCAHQENGTHFPRTPGAPPGVRCFPVSCTRVTDKQSRRILVRPV